MNSRPADVLAKQFEMLDPLQVMLFWVFFLKHLELTESKRIRGNSILMYYTLYDLYVTAFPCNVNLIMKLDQAIISG